MPTTHTIATHDPNRLAETIKGAGQGDTIIVHSEQMRALAVRAMRRHGKTDLRLVLRVPAGDAGKGKGR